MSSKRQVSFAGEFDTVEGLQLVNTSMEAVNTYLKYVFIVLFET